MARGEEAEQEGSADISLAPSARVCFVFSWIWVWRNAEDKVVRAQSWQAACLLWGAPFGSLHTFQLGLCLGFLRGEALPSSA